MKRFASVLAPSLIAVSAALAPLSALAQDIDVRRLHEHTALLASDRHEGRGPATPAERLTVDYIIAQMMNAGLQPGGVNGTWVQTVGLNFFKLSDPVAATIKVGSWSKPLNQGIDVALRTRLPQERLTLANAPVVFVGYGVKAPERNWDDYKGVDLKGKVALVLVNDPDFELDQPGDFEGERMTYYGRWTYKFEELARQGAAGVIVIHETVPIGYGWPTVRNSNTNGVFDIVLENPAAQRAKLEGFIQKPVAEEIFRRAGLDFAAEKAGAKTRGFRPVTLKGAGFNTDVAVAVTRTQSDNVIGRLPGSARPDETVLIGAHWDHLGRAQPDADGDDIYNGALDNATGVAGLLELARVMAAGPKHQRSVVFAAWTVEERGLLGSEFYASNPVYPLAKTAATFNMDGLAIAGPARDLTFVGGGQSQLDEAATRVATGMNLRISPEANPEVGSYYRSDHFPLAKVGVPALYINIGQDLVNGGVAAGKAADEAYIADKYHQPNDEYDPNWDLTGALPELNIIRTLTADIANSTAWPEWKPTSEFIGARRASAAQRR
jgi:Zn-dependent M28 family amino/carboxypeptidase